MTARIWPLHLGSGRENFLGDRFSSGFSTLILRFYVVYGKIKLSVYVVHYRIAIITLIRLFIWQPTGVIFKCRFNGGLFGLTELSFLLTPCYCNRPYMLSSSSSKIRLSIKVA